MVRQYLEKTNVRFIRLNPQNTIKKFTCGDPDLDDFICNRASEFQKHLLSVSYACADADTGKMLAYCSLANDKVAMGDFKDKTEFNRFRKKQGFPNEKLAVVRNPQIRLILESVDGGYFSRTSFGFGDVKF